MRKRHDGVKISSYACSLRERRQRERERGRKGKKDRESEEGFIDIDDF